MITIYKCEICYREYKTAKDTEECEAVGQYTPWEEHKRGIMWEYNHNGYVGIFSIAVDKKFHTNGHLGELSYWACRAPEYSGDTVGENKCGSNLYKRGEYDKWKEHHIITKEKVNSPEYNRMVAFLKSEGIQPSYYNEQGELIQDSSTKESK